MINCEYLGIVNIHLGKHRTICIYMLKYQKNSDKKIMTKKNKSKQNKTKM